MLKIGIIGLGLIGGSLGMALRKAGGEYQLLGYDQDSRALKTAKRRGAIDQETDSAARLAADADLVVIATPPGSVGEVLREIGPHLRPGCVVTDTASTKTTVMAWAAEFLPANIHFVGGHPMAGRELSGVEAADPDLFRDCTYCVVPSASAGDAAVGLISHMVTAIGAQPLFIDSVEHDSFVAAISHLPFLAATALVRSTTCSPAWRDMSSVAATGFRDTTRVASGNTAMYRDICLTNRESILRWLDTFAAEIARLRALVESGDPEVLEASLRQAKEARDEWLRKFEKERESWPTEEMESGSQMRQMFMGRLAGGQPKDRPR